MQQRKDKGSRERQTPLRQIGGLGKSRIEALADGIFAVAMTLLVFNVHVPDLSKVQTVGDILSLLFVTNDQGPQGAVLIAYALSFAQLGVYWVSHQAQFQYIQRTDRYLLWINILFLLLVSFVPFTTQMLGANWIRANSVVHTTVLLIYGVHLILIGSVVYLHWWYATHRCRLTAPDLSTHLIRAAAQRILAAPIICLLAFIFAFINPVASMICYLLIPIYYILPGRVDWHWSAPHHNHATTMPTTERPDEQSQEPEAKE